MKKLILMTIALISLTVTANAAVKTFSCDFPEYSNKKGVYRVKDEFKLSFMINDTTKKAYLTGNHGSDEVYLIWGPGSVNFIEITGFGNLTATTIAFGESGKMEYGVKYIAVHSRQPNLFGEIIPSQYYGTCELR